MRGSSVFWLALLVTLPLIAFGWALGLALFGVAVLALIAHDRYTQTPGRHRQ